MRGESLERVECQPASWDATITRMSDLNSGLRDLCLENVGKDVMKLRMNGSYCRLVLAVSCFWGHDITN
jgi:hypothetical protein